MSAKKKSSIHSMWQIENMVQKQIQEALSGNFFQSISSMRADQLQHAKQFQEQMKGWQGFSFWDMPDQVSSTTQNSESIYTNSTNPTQQENDQDIKDMSHLADGLQKQIQTFVKQVLNKAGSSDGTP